VSDDQNRTEAHRWAGQAEDDLRFARVGVKERFYAQACFLSQQAGEKALKALRYLRGERRVLGHSLVVLVDSLAGELTDHATLRSLAAELDLHYVPARYPNGLPDVAPFQAYSREQAVRAVAAAERFVSVARETLKKPPPGPATGDAG
jgi:HEPN domain-containing protein